MIRLINAFLASLLFVGSMNAGQQIFANDTTFTLSVTLKASNQSITHQIDPRKIETFNFNGEVISSVRVQAVPSDQEQLLPFPDTKIFSGASIDTSGNAQIAIGNNEQGFFLDLSANEDSSFYS